MKYAFINSLVPAVLDIQSSSALDVVSFARDIKKGDIESVMRRFKSLFAMLPYTTFGKGKADGVVEQNFHNVFYLVFTLLGSGQGLRKPPRWGGRTASWKTAATCSSLSSSATKARTRLCAR